MTREEIKKEIVACIHAYKSEPMIIYKGKNCEVLDEYDINRIAYRCACHILGSFINDENDEIVSVPKHEYELLLNNKKHETDLLKQFVEYLKNKYTKSEKEQLEIIYNVYLKEDNRLKSNFHDGCRFGFELARTSMGQDLEKFLEERK